MVPESRSRDTTSNDQSRNRPQSPQVFCDQCKKYDIRRTFSSDAVELSDAVEEIDVCNVKSLW